MYLGLQEAGTWWCVGVVSTLPSYFALSVVKRKADIQVKMKKSERHLVTVEAFLHIHRVAASGRLAAYWCRLDSAEPFCIVCCEK